VQEVKRYGQMNVFAYVSLTLREKKRVEKSNKIY
jgi:hypothetical protein